jgi:hypothetical protein
MSKYGLHRVPRARCLENASMLRFQPIKVATTSSDCNGMLITNDGFLIAVIVQLEPENHGDALAGKWNLDAAFDHLPYPPDQVFDDLDHAEAWLNERLEAGRWAEARQARAKRQSAFEGSAFPSSAAE